MVVLFIIVKITMGKVIDLTYQVFGRLTVMSRGLNDNKNRTMWNCICECGNVHDTTSAMLRKGCTKSCGCLRSDKAAKINFSHGDCDSKEYRAWTTMKARCLNKRMKRYIDYGGRGITICDLWINSYSQFLKDVGRAPSPKHSLDKINNDGNYEPGNVKWSTPLEQIKNRRTAKKAILS